MDDLRTTLAVQRYLDELGDLRGDSPAEPVVRDLLGRAVDRLHALCARLLHQSYPRLTRGPLNLRSEEMLGAVVERLIKAMREIRPQTVRQFFALANRHMRWELNDLARRLDERAAAVELRESRAEAGPQPGAEADSPSQVSPVAHRILGAIERLPDDERDVFELVRLQGLTHVEAAGVLEVSVKTIQRRLNRGLVLLANDLKDIRPGGPDLSDPGAAGADEAGAGPAPLPD